jgi:chorismate-pyruvate lyase
MAVSAVKTLAEAAELSLLMPLHFFYAQAGRPLPQLVFMEAHELPENERELLVHDHDMTSALRVYHQNPLALRVEAREGSEAYLLRLVVLETAGEGARPVEFGAIAIQVENFPPESQSLILAGQRPLGAVLVEHRVPFVSEPQAFFCVAADAFIAQQLRVPERTILYGRCNVLSTPDGDVLAEIVEILPPAHDPVPLAIHPVRRSGPG